MGGTGMQMRAPQEWVTRKTSEPAPCFARPLQRRLAGRAGPRCRRGRVLVLHVTPGNLFDCDGQKLVPQEVCAPGSRF